MLNDALDTPSEGFVGSVRRVETNFWDEVVRSVRAEYLSDAQDYPWIIGFSGGKDSTVVAQAVFEALLQVSPSRRKRHVHFVIQLYRDAEGGECPVVLSKDEAPGCGTSSKYPPAKPGALEIGPLEAALGPLTRPQKFGSTFVHHHLMIDRPKSHLTFAYRRAAHRTRSISSFYAHSRPKRVSGSIFCPHLRIHFRRFAIATAPTATSGNVELLLPPRQSREISYAGLANRPNSEGGMRP